MQVDPYCSFIKEKLQTIERFYPGKVVQDKSPSIYTNLYSAMYFVVLGSPQQVHSTTTTFNIRASLDQANGRSFLYLTPETAGPA